MTPRPRDRASRRRSLGRSRELALLRAAHLGVASRRVASRFAVVPILPHPSAHGDASRRGEPSRSTGRSPRARRRRCSPSPCARARARREARARARRDIGTARGERARARAENARARAVGTPTRGRGRTPLSSPRDVARARERRACATRAVEREDERRGLVARDGRGGEDGEFVVEAFDTSDELARALCLEVEENARGCLEERGAFTMAIPGGSVKALKGLANGFGLGKGARLLRERAAGGAKVREIGGGDVDRGVRDSRGERASGAGDGGHGAGGQ